VPENPKPPDDGPSASPSLNRRRHPRQAVDFPVRYRRVDPHDLSAGPQEYQEGTCRNISESGMLLEVEAHIAPDVNLEVYVSDRGRDTTIFGIVETVRRARTPDHYELGVRFVTREDV